MMITNMQPLTSEQRQFAEDNHDLVIRFLGYKRLNYDEYYDILIFGFIRAVRKYLERSELQQYSFNTIAYWAMRSDLINYYRKQDRQKRYAIIVNLDSPVSHTERVIDTIETADTTADDVLYDSLLNEIAEVLSVEQFEIIQMKASGYSEREIARLYDISVQSVQEMLAVAKESVYSVLM